MEASFIAAGLLHPIALLMLALVMFVAIHLGSQSGAPNARMSWHRLLGGFVGVLTASLLVSATSSYVSPEGAARFGVNPENYASALWNQFVVLAVLCAYVSLVGCAVIGLPAILALTKRGYGTAPAVVAISVPISLLVLVPLGLLSSISPKHVAQSMLYLVPGHIAVALGFAIGARLPWQLRKQGANDA